MLDFINEKICTGCKMCGDICPEGAISYKVNDEGFWYPEVNKELCTGCGLCERSCPEINVHRKEKIGEPTVYSAYSKESVVRDASTSGGVFKELATTVLEMGGVVVGSAYSEDCKAAYHTMIDNVDDLAILMGTKYFQSDSSGIYNKVKIVLDEGKPVLFAGTPCQNAALRMYLKNDYENLYQMDFICNAISSPLAYRKYLEELEEKYGAAVKTVRFKDKKYGWTRLTTRITFENGKVYEEDRNNSLWSRGLNKYNLYQRECCYNCNYRQILHWFADITVGDFWGLEAEDAYDMFKGISIAMINSAKGEQLFKKTKSRLFIKKRAISDVLKGNTRVLQNPVLHQNRKLFFELLETMPFSNCIKICTGETKKRISKRKLEVQRIFKYFREGKVSVWKYIYLNYFSRNVIRLGEAKIVPWKNVIFDLEPDAQIILEGYKDLEIGTNKLKGSKSETYIRMEKGAEWKLLHGGKLNYGVTVEIKRNAMLEMGYVGFNTGSVVVVQEKIKLGEGIACGRNCIFMDSDFHQMQTRNGVPFNTSQQIIVKDHVWFTGNTKVLKGVTIGENCVIDSNVVIKKDIAANSLVSSEGRLKIVEFPGRWSDKTNVTSCTNLFKDKKQILVGYGKDGKSYYQKQKDYIDVVIDNNSTDRLTITFDEFVKKNSKVGEDYVFVIGSTKYYRELSKMVRKAYPKARIETIN